MQEELSPANPLGMFASAFLLSSFAGLASLLRSGANVNAKSVISAALNSGLLGLALSLIWYWKFSDNIYFLVGICVLAGLGGMTAIDFVLTALKKGGFNISFTKEQGVKMGETTNDK